MQPVQSAFIVNLGDMLERWTGSFVSFFFFFFFFCLSPLIPFSLPPTGGLFKSTFHRVVNKEGKERFSAPFFFEPNFDAKISPLPSPQVQDFVKESGKEWEEVTSGEWLLGKYAQTHTDFSVEEN